MLTLVEVAITYAWFTRLRGTPLILNGPLQNKKNDMKALKIQRIKILINLREIK